MIGMVLQNQILSLRSMLSIDVFPMPNLDHNDNQDVIINAVQNAVCALPNSISIRVTRELFAPRRPRIFRKRQNSLDNLTTYLLGLGRLDFFGC
jgi:hypothetical protein